MIITLWCIPLSILLVWGMGRYAGHIRGSALAVWQRWLIPLPIFLIAYSNLDAVLSLKAYLESHPNAIPARIIENQPMGTTSMDFWGLLGIFLLPFPLCSKFSDLWHLAPFVWLCYLAWLILVLFPLALSTGYPLTQD